MRHAVIATLLGAALASCVANRWASPRVTGTCAGACAHYVECKPGHSDRDGARCRAECPDVFADADSLGAYESLSCKDAVEFVDGTNPRAASATPR